MASPALTTNTHWWCRELAPLGIMEFPNCTLLLKSKFKEFLHQDKPLLAIQVSQLIRNE